MDLLDKMATFVRVFDTGSFSAAAKAQRISPAAVSRQIATLERELGAALFLRNTRRMVATEIGGRYYEQCVRILADVDAAQTLAARCEASGIIHLSASVSFGTHFIAPLLRSLVHTRRELLVDLRIEDRNTDLSLDGIDVAIRVSEAPPDSGELVAHRLLDLERFLVASPAYLRRRGTPRTPEDLRKHDALSLLSGGRTETWTLDNGDTTARVPVAVHFRCNSHQVLVDYALAGEGVAKLSAPIVESALRSRKLRRILPAWRSPASTVWAIHKRALRSAGRVRTLIEHLRTSLR